MFCGIFVNLVLYRLYHERMPREKVDYVLISSLVTFLKTWTGFGECSKDVDKDLGGYHLKFSVSDPNYAFKFPCSFLWI